MNTSKVLSGASANEPLLTTYYCNVKESKLDAVMELKVRNTSQDTSSPQRFTLVIDVSGSMGNPIREGDPCTLLDRVKVFAKLFVDSLKDCNYLSIVTFSDASSKLDMTLMSEDNKISAKEWITQLNAENGTNLELGLKEGLKLSNVAHPDREQTHDCIILFTDGEANLGECRSENLIAMYQNKLNEMMAGGRVNQVQLVTTTIGDYKPCLLCEITAKLSSDSFYLLNCNKAFEVDMLIPLFLRQSSYLSDIQTELKCMDGVTLTKEYETTHGLQKRIGNTGLKYFFHGLFSSVVKHIYVSLDITKTKRNIVLEISVSYLDANLKRRKIKDLVQLVTTPESQNLHQEDHSEVAQIQPQPTFFHGQCSSYVVVSNSVHISSKWMEKAFERVLSERGRMVTLQAMASECIRSAEIDILGAKTKLDDALELLKEIQGLAQISFDDKSIHHRKLSFNLNSLSDNLKFCNDNIETMPWSRSQAIASSLETEMPTASGVFKQDIMQPYMSGEILNKIAEVYGEVCEGIAVENEFYKQIKDQENALEQLKKAKENRNAQKIGEAIDLCIEKGVDDEDEINSACSLLEVVLEEDSLFAEIESSLKQRNYHKLTKLIQEFRDSQNSFVDKNSVYKRGVEFATEGARRLKLDIEEALEAENDQVMEELIPDLQLFCDVGFVEESEISFFNKKLRILREQLRLQSRFNNLMEVVETFISTEALTELEDSLVQIESVMNEEYYKERESNLMFYSSSCTKLENLIEKRQLKKEIKLKWKERVVDWIPQSVEKLKKVYSEMQELKQRALKSPESDVFTNDDENNLYLLESDIESLEEEARLKVEAEAYLRKEMKKDTYEGIKKAVEKAENVLFVDEDLVETAEKRFNFLNPETRINELENATEGKSLEGLNQAIKDFKEARVNSRNNVLSRAERRLQKLKDAEPLNTRLKNAMENATRNENFEELKRAIRSCETNARIREQDIELYEEAMALKKELTFQKYYDLLTEAIESENRSKVSEALEKVREIGDLQCKNRLRDIIEKAKTFHDERRF